jgi:nitroreductase
MSKIAQPDHPVHELIARRWSPYAFDDRAVPGADLRSLFEAARWSASSFNEQPWRFIVATRDDRAAFEDALSCLSEGNRDWAAAAPVLAIGIARNRFSHNDKPNRVALHDLGLAVANLTLEATARGLSVHQMAGMLPDRARELYRIPAEFDAHTAFAVGYARGSLDDVPEELRRRDTAPRSRRPQNEFVFAGRWERPAGL